MEIVCNMSTLDLVAIVKKNREAHVAMRAEALAGYCKSAEQECAKAVADLKEGKAIRVDIRLQPPADHTAEYDRAIGMLSKTSATEVELNEHDFATLVNDDWDWLQSWVHSNRRFSERLDAYGSGKGI